MKHKFTLLSIIFILAGSVLYSSKLHSSAVTKSHKQTSDYSEGWKDGYKDGWCYQKGYGCYPAYPPYPPYPRYGEDNYKGGYNRGFLQALHDRDQ